VKTHPAWLCTACAKKALGDPFEEKPLGTVLGVTTCAMCVEEFKPTELHYVLAPLSALWDKRGLVDQFFGLLSERGLRWCGCADPEAFLRRLESYLSVVAASRERLKAAVWPSQDAGDQMAWLYMLDAAGLTEHGGSVGACWLTGPGSELHAQVRQVLSLLDDGAAG
jgi:hypothetical protein